MRLRTFATNCEILDEQTDGDRVIVTVEGAERAIALLGREGVEIRVVDLNLDEIFEAYVAGKRPRRGHRAARPNFNR